MAKVLIVQPIAQEGIDLLLQGGLEVKQVHSPPRETFLQEVTETEAILVRDAPISREIIERGKNLKVISRHGAGLDRIDLQAATERGVVVTYTPVANSVSVAEHVLGLMFALTKNLCRMDRALRGGDFEIRHRFYGMELEGKTLGIVGLGNVGRRLATKASQGLGMRVMGYDPYVRAEDLPSGTELASDWDTVFREGDFVSLHLPLTPQTREGVGKREFWSMRKTAFFINCARGAIVREGDLVEALQKGVIAGAGLDVYSISPPPRDNPLWTLENTIVTPHSAAHTREAMANMAVQAAQGILEVLSGREPTWPANRIRTKA
jgi:D-3-phosphoglycerate dehydrogenase